MLTDEERIRDLEGEVRELRSMVVYLKEQMRIAGNYKNDDTNARVDGVQAALLRGSEYQGRPASGRRRR